MIGKINSVVDSNASTLWTALPADVRRAFRGEHADRVPLSEGFLLYKYTEPGENQSVPSIRNAWGQITPWWSTYERYGLDPGLTQRRALATLLGVSAGELTRTVAAVKENWNALTWLVTAKLLKPAFAFWGQCSPQRRLDFGATPRAGVRSGRTINLPGYAWQFYIPNLTMDDIALVSFERA